jgi:hypothetical protein
VVDDEFMVTVRFTIPRRKEIKSTIRSRYETIETCADKNRSLHCGIPPLESLLITQRRMWPVKIAFTMTNVNAAARQRRTALKLRTAAYSLLRSHSTTINSFHAFPSSDFSPRQVKCVLEVLVYVARVYACAASTGASSLKA